MNTYLDNLRPFERRVVVAAAALLFVVLNLWFVFPHFSDWGRVQDRMFDAQRKLGRYDAEIAQMHSISNQVRRLEGEGAVVPPEAQSLHFSSAIQSQSVQSHVSIPQTGKIMARTNQFFLELSQSITVQGGEPELVDFLYHLGSGNSLIRVRSLGLRPDGPRQQLVAGATVAASYQKKPPSKPASTAASATSIAKRP
jgi:hypothetical protein